MKQFLSIFKIYSADVLNLLKAMCYSIAVDKKFL